MNNLYYNPTSEKWESVPYMVKEHSVPIQVGKETYLATLVVVPTGEDEKGNMTFHKTGVRIECVKGFQGRNIWREPGYSFTLPGATYFYHFGRQKCSECPPCVFRRDLCDRPLDAGYGKAQVIPTTDKVKGKPLTEFPSWVASAVQLAKESYATWLEAKRKAA